MYSIAYIADNDDTNKVYFEVDPVPTPLPVYQPISSKRRLLNKREGEKIVPGDYHHYIGGASISGAIIQANIRQMSRTSYNSIVAKMIKADSVIFSPDGSTKYECVFSPSSGQPAYIEGTDYIEWSLTFDIIGVV